MPRNGVVKGSFVHTVVHSLCTQRRCIRYRSGRPSSRLIHEDERQPGQKTSGRGTLTACRPVLQAVLHKQLKESWAGIDSGRLAKDRRIFGSLTVPRAARTVGSSCDLLGVTSSAAPTPVLLHPPLHHHRTFRVSGVSE
jgi:hypothetical protein